MNYKDGEIFDYLNKWGVVKENNRVTFQSRIPNSEKVLDFSLL
jgi:hypothetical protein